MLQADIEPRGLQTILAGASRASTSGKTLFANRQMLCPWTIPARSALCLTSPMNRADMPMRLSNHPVPQVRGTR
jgi:hypothetical protein